MISSRRLGIFVSAGGLALGVVLFLASCSSEDQSRTEMSARAVETSTVTVSGKITTSGGVALAGHQVVFGSVRTETGSDGSYSLEVAPAVLSVQVYSVAGGVAFPTGLVNVYGFPISSRLSFVIGRQMTISAPTILDITIPTRVLRGTVQDQNGQPLAGGTVFSDLWGRSRAVGDGGADPWTWTSITQSTTLDASGNLYLVVVPGGGTLTVNPSDGSGLTPYQVPEAVADDLSVTIKYPSPVALEGTVITSDGLPISGQTVGVGTVKSQTDSEGRFSLAVVPGQTDVGVGSSASVQIPTGLVASNGSGGSAGSAIYSALSFRAYRTYAVSSATTLELSMPTRVISGVVRASDGAPIPGANVKVANWTCPSTPGLDHWSTSLQSASTSCDQDGRYRLYVLAGSGNLTVTPPPGSGLALTQVSATALSDVTVDVTFPAAANISGKVSTSGGSLLVEQGVSLGVATAKTDTGGKYSLLVPLGSGTLVVSSGTSGVLMPTGLTSNGTSTGTPIYSNLEYGMSLSLSVSGAMTVDAVVPTRLLSGTVRDPDGHFVACDRLSTQKTWTIDFGNADGGTNVWSGSLISADTTCSRSGEFRFVLTAGSVRILVSPPTGSGLTSATLQMTMVDDRQQDITLPFATNQISGTLPSGGGTVTTDTGSGASASDPVTTKVVSHNAGTVSITEAPIDLQTTPPPTGHTFLTQEVQISAPDASSAAAPLELTFTLDASRIPAGRAGDITITRNGVVVGVCTGAAGAASPDPCESHRQVITGGDLQITVLSTQAGRWHFALAGGNPGTGGTGGSGGAGSGDAGGSGGAGSSGAGGSGGAGSSGAGGSGGVGSGGAGVSGSGGAAGSAGGAAGSTGAAGTGGSTVATSAAGSSGSVGTGGVAGSSGLSGGAGAPGPMGVGGIVASGDAVDAGVASDAFVSSMDAGSDVGVSDPHIDAGWAAAVDAAVVDGGNAVVDAQGVPDSSPVGADGRSVDLVALGPGDAVQADALTILAQDVAVEDASHDIGNQVTDASTAAVGGNGIRHSGGGCALGGRPPASLPALGWILVASALLLAARRRSKTPWRTEILP